MSTKSKFIVALFTLTAAACGESPTGAIEPPAQISFVCAGTLVTATPTAATGEIVVPETAVTGRLVVRLGESDGSGYQTRALIRLEVHSANTGIAYWDGTDSGPFTGKVIGLKTGQTSLVFSIILEESGDLIFRSAPVPVKVRLAE